MVTTYPSDSNAGGPSEPHRDDEAGRASDVEPRPRTGGEVTGLGPIQIALGLLALFGVLLVLWMLWPLVSGS